MKVSKKIYYLFRRPVLNNIQQAYKGNYPLDFFYGYTQVSKQFNTLVSDRAESNKFIKVLQNLLGKIIYKIFKVDIALIPVILQLDNISKTDIIFSTIDSYGLAVLILKKAGLLKRQTLIFNTIGLCDALVEQNNRIIINFFRKICRNVDLFISGASQIECIKLSQLLSLPLSKFKFIPFGIDTDYFLKGNKNTEGYILAIGADKNRDWALYKKLFLEFPKEKFVIITNPGLIKEEMPENAEIIYNLSIDKVREFIRKAKFLVILSRQNYHFAGQSTAFRSMSMNKTVIFTRSHGVSEYQFKNKKECLLVEPGNFLSLHKAFLIANNNKSCALISKNARSKIVSDLSIKRYASTLNKTFLDL